VQAENFHNSASLRSSAFDTDYFCIKAITLLAVSKFIEKLLAASSPQSVATQ